MRIAGWPTSSPHRTFTAGNSPRCIANVFGCVEVRVVGMTTGNALEIGLGAPIGFVYVFARIAGLACVRRVDSLKTSTRPGQFVLYKTAKLSQALVGKM